MWRRQENKRDFGHKTPLQRWDAYNDIIWWLLELHWEHSPIYLLPGLLLGLCRLPAGKTRPKEEYKK
ncbi:MAG: hypothetical protein IJC15_06125 [Clostridia bacterium]|nr:hypothetical protein [Clostridia bacterium]MBQ9924742.1 hypothetical protein [Clostridia bacterium]